MLKVRTRVTAVHKPDLKAVSVISAMLALLPHHLLLPALTLLRIQVYLQAANVVGEGVGGGVVHLGACLGGQGCYRGLY